MSILLKLFGWVYKDLLDSHETLLLNIQLKKYIGSGLPAFQKSHGRQTHKVYSG